MTAEGPVSEGLAALERRRLRRRLALWRVIAIAAVVAAAATAFAVSTPRGAHVARFAVVGPIFDDPDRDRTLTALAEDDAVEAVILRLNSPGGSVAGSEALYEALRDVAQAKPVAAVMGEAAASGGYIAALAADHIVARGGTITGSIGVVAEYPDLSGLLDRLGVGVSRVASDPLKAEPSPFRPPNPAALAAQEALIADSHAWFLGLVAERRGLSAEEARRLGDGRVYTGRMAAAEGLVDAVGGEAEAVAWMEQARGVDPDLPIRDVEVARDAPGLSALLDEARAGLAAARAALGPRLMAVADWRAPGWAAAPR